MANPCVPWNERKDNDLADTAEQGLHGQGSVVEAMRRLRKQFEIHSARLLWATIVLIVLTAVLTVLTLKLVGWWPF